LSAPARATALLAALFALVTADGRAIAGLTGARTLAREHDPVVVPWRKLAGLPVNDTTHLRLFRVAGGRLEPIRFQFDARDRDGDLIVDGPRELDLDDDDELVFMARDAGDRAPPELFARSEPALEIELADPRDDARAWAYLVAYREPQPAPALAPYVSFDLASRQARSDFYRVGYAPERNFFTGIEILGAAGGNAANLLRQTRMHGSPTFGLLLTDWTLDFTEQSSIVEIDGVRQGPVRAVRRARLSVDLGPLFPDLPSGVAYTYHYRSSYLTPTRIGFPWIMLEMLRDFRFENVFDFTAEALPLRYFDAWYREGLVLSDASPLEVRTAEDREWWVHSGSTGTVLHAFVIPEKWREWGVVRGTVVRSAGGAGREGGEREDREPDDATAEPRFAAGYTLLNMTRLKEAGSYDLLMASIVVPGGYAPGAEAEPMAMLRAPLAVEVRQVR
jgi:hypothetical protein